MSTYPTDDPVPATPLFDETARTTAVGVLPDDLDSADRSKQDAAKDAAGQAKSTVQDTAGQVKDTVAGTADQAKDEVRAVGSTAADAGHRVADTTKEQASRVAGDAAGQARELVGQATEQLSQQAAKQQKSAASTLRTFGKDLSGMHEQQDGGLASELVQNLAKRANSVADWLEDREPAQVLDEVKQFAASRPGLFIGLAAITGVVAARATKALTASSSNGPTTTPSTRSTSDTRAADGYGAYGTADLSGATYSTPSADYDTSYSSGVTGTGEVR